ncbi:conserved hypothetical protein [Flavobacterium sp. 9AF]|uniref:hypothetical protein n=1 Tax=Flavobacterium sp. 9AF TaxID=2653142 RepID=UPI0012F30381|nr:hypothetical protein [Flavobacterium sp. 9AF]VXB07811.1 conserved hypothetical protein [Flavobacterium sp. 9AF]
MTKKLLLLTLFLFSLSCKETHQEPLKSPEEQIQSFYAEEEDTILPNDAEEITEVEKKTYHIDKTHKYEYRTGRIEHYEYNYDIVGHDAEGNEIKGNINIRNKYGAGKIVNAKGEKKDVFVQWIDYGKLIGKDQDSITYEFVVE